MRAAVLALLLLVLAAAEAKMAIGYYTAWSTYGRNYQVADIPAQYLTHINYAFANIQGGKCVLGDPYADVDKMFPGDTWDQELKGNFNQLIQLKKKHPHLKTLISVGGWTWSRDFSDAALTDSSRAVFVESCIEFMLKYSFDGIDIDWEYPVEGGLESNIYRPEDGVNHALLMRKFREELDKRSGGQRRYLLSIAAPAGESKYRHLVLDDLAETLDLINLMTYDYQGGWSNVTGHQSAIYANSSDPEIGLGYYADKAMTDFVKRGYPAANLLIGAAFYGRGFKEVSTMNNGLFQPFNGVPPGTWDSTGVFDYDDIKNNLIGKQGYSEFYDAEAQGAWVFNPSTRIMVSYDSPRVISDKCRYANAGGYGGVFNWEMSADRQGELMRIIHETLA